MGITSNSVATESIYVLTNESLPGKVKIGRTERSPEERASELWSTGVPTAFRVFRAYLVENSVEAESLIHERLKDCRISNDLEFFNIEPELACSIIEDLLATKIEQNEINPDEEDSLLAEATELAIKEKNVWPSLLSGRLGISHEKAEWAIAMLKGRGVLEPNGNLSLAFVGEEYKEVTPARIKKLKNKSQPQREQDYREFNTSVPPPVALSPTAFSKRRSAFDSLGEGFSIWKVIWVIFAVFVILAKCSN